MIALIVVERPTPLRPSKPTISPSPTWNVDAVQNMALAVIGLEAHDFEQRRAHQGAACPR